MELKLGSIRIPKFKSQNLSYFILFKISIIGYLLIALAGYVTSNTTAYYSDHQRIDGSITIGTWESEEEGQQEQQEQQQSSDETDRIEDGIESEQNLESKQPNEPMGKSNEGVENDIELKW